MEAALTLDELELPSSRLTLLKRDVNSVTRSVNVV